MNFDEIVYAVILVGSIFLGKAISLTKLPWTKQVLSTSVGVLLVVSICRWNALHSFIVVCVNCFIVTFLRRRSCHLVSFIFSFGYLLFFRTTSFFELPEISPHENALQLCLTLKVVGLAFEIHDSDANQRAALDESKSEKGEIKFHLLCKYQNVSPSCLDIFCYSYCFIGLFTGPFYKYRTYEDMLKSRYGSKSSDTTTLRNNIAQVLVYLVSYVILSKFFSIQYAKSDEFYETSSVFYRMFYTFPIFTIFRFRLYVAFLLSECACIVSGLGAYPSSSKSRPGNGPTDFVALETILSNKSDASHSSDVKSDATSDVTSDVKNDVTGDITGDITGDVTGDITDDVTGDVTGDFRTIDNIDIWECEFAPSMRQSIRSWNKTVQYWLANNVYRRLAGASTIVKIGVTMAVSAYWHGIHPGYYMTFLSVPFYLAAEDSLVSKETSTPDGSSSIRRWICWFIRMRSSEYLGVGFLFLGFKETLRYWTSVYFYGHVLILAGVLVGTWWSVVNRVKNKVQ